MSVKIPGLMTLVSDRALSNVISGQPVVYGPYIELAKYAAAHRNYYWQYVRKTKANTHIEIATEGGPYPSKSRQISDQPKSDGGNNFGRLARYGTMEAYVNETLATEVRGVPASQWLRVL